MLTPFLALPVLLVAVLQAAPPATQPAAGPLAGESRQIESVTAGQLLRPRDASSKDGTPIVLYPHQDWKCLTWKFEPAPPTVGSEPNTYRLVNHFTHKTFSPSAADPTKLTQLPTKSATDASLLRLTELPDHTYRIDHPASGLSLTTSPDGNPILAQWTGADAQKWKLLPKPEHFTG